MKLRQMQHSLSQPISIMQNKKELFAGYFCDLKKTFSRDEWDKILDKEVLDRRDYFEFDVIEICE